VRPNSVSYFRLFGRVSRGSSSGWNGSARSALHSAPYPFLGHVNLVVSLPRDFDVRIARHCGAWRDINGSPDKSMGAVCQSGLAPFRSPAMVSAIEAKNSISDSV